MIRITRFQQTRRGLVALCVFVSVGFLMSSDSDAGEAQSQADETREPLPVLKLRVEDQVIPVEIDQPFDCTLHGKNVTMTLLAEPYRVLHIAQAEFRFPREFAFQYDAADKGVWTVVGEKVLIMLVRKDGADYRAAADEMADAMVKQYVKFGVKESESTITLDGHQFAGKKLVLASGGRILQQEIFGLPGGTSSLILLIQDRPDQPGKSTDEARRTRSMLVESFRLSKAAPDAAVAVDPAAVSSELKTESGKITTPPDF